MKATLVDVHTVSREIDIPDTCAKCRIDLTGSIDGKNAIIAWEFQDQQRFGQAPMGRFALDPCGGGCMPEGGEHFISYVEYRCENCGHSLAENSGSDEDVGELPEGAEHARYTLDLWWEALRENQTLRCSYETWVGQCLRADGVLKEER